MRAWKIAAAYLDLAPAVGDGLGLDAHSLGHSVDVKLFKYQFRPFSYRK